MQRGYDQVIHDVAIQNLPVRMILDRAGVVGNDGPTHHGCYDLAYMGCIPNLTIMSPSNEIELRNMVATCAAFDDGPTVLRYPRGTGYGQEKLESLFGYKFENGEMPTKGNSVGACTVLLFPTIFCCLSVFPLTIDLQYSRICRRSR